MISSCRFSSCVMDALFKLSAIGHGIIGKVVLLELLKRILHDFCNYKCKYKFQMIQITIHDNDIN